MDPFQIKAREPLFFMHIPKTAGMSMRLYLSEQYQVQDICPVLRWQGLIGRENEIHTFRLVQGHFRHNLRELVASDARVLVMLREPLRRTVSALQHLQRDPSFHLDHELAQGLSMAEMIRHPVLMQNQRNVQAWFLCASIAPDRVSAYLERELPRNLNADAGDLEQPPELKLATDRLEAIDFVGLTEDIGAVVSSMAQAMNYHPPLYFPFINENPNRTDPLQALNDDDIGILRANNDVDLQLYDYAKRLIERRVFARDMRQLIHSGVYTVPPGSFEIPLSGIMPGSGWYAPDQENGRSWRWTGPRRHFTIEVPLREDASYRLIMSFGSLRPLGPGDLTAEVNDVPVDFGLSPEGRGYVCELIIPRDLLVQSSGFCRIRFDTLETTQLAPPDIRSLGVAIRKILFECQEA
jgi:hypothetical protein